MPNAYRDNVWVIDTASATNVTDDMVLIDTIRWVAAAGNAEIADGEGNVVWASDSALTTEESRAYLKLKGLRVPTLGGGVLYLYHDLNRD